MPASERGVKPRRAVRVAASLPGLPRRSDDARRQSGVRAARRRPGGQVRLRRASRASLDGRREAVV